MRRIGSPGAALAALLALAPPAGAAAPDLMLVLDASGSMWGPARPGM